MRENADLPEVSKGAVSAGGNEPSGKVACEQTEDSQGRAGKRTQEIKLTAYNSSKPVLGRGYIRDLTGLVVGRLTVVRYDHTDRNGRAMWFCQCICGGSKIVGSQHLVGSDNNLTKSCGCLQKECSVALGKKQGKANKGVPSSTRGMPRSQAFKDAIRKSAKGRKISRTFRMLGRHHKPESIAKMLSTNRLRYGSPLGPRNGSKAEKAVEEWIRGNGISDYKVQYQTGYFVSDFYIPSLNLIIEVDGCWWHRCPIHFNTGDSQRFRDKDMKRTKNLEALGYNVLRIWEHDIPSLGVDYDY